MKNFEKPRQNNPLELEHEETKIVKTLESLPFLHMYSLGNKVDLLLVYAGMKLATDITIGKLGERGQQPQSLSEEEINSVREKIESGGLVSVHLPKEEDVIEGIDEGEVEPSVKYRFEKAEFFVAKNMTQAEALKNAESKNDETYGQLSGFPESAIRAYLEAERDPTALIEIKDLPEEIKKEDFMAFATFRLSRKNWMEEIETVKKWAHEIKKIDPALYEEAVEDYKKRSSNP